MTEQDEDTRPSMKPRDAEAATFDSLMQRLQQGDSASAAEVFARFQVRLINLARRHVTSVQVRQKFDADDVVQSALFSFWRRCQDGEFEFNSWDSLWSLLRTMTVRRTRKYLRRYRSTRKRDLQKEMPLEDSVASGRAPEATAPTPLVSGGA